ncbi:MAG: dockerin type I domain-containing protein [Candidatus Omnitrophota bacterium]
MKTKTFSSFRRSLYSLICGICVSLFMVVSVSIADATDVDVAKELATNDALSRDWNLSSYGSNYSPTACSKIDIGSVASAGDGLYTVKAKMTLTTTYTYGTSTYSYTFTQDVEYSVNAATGKVVKFVYAPNNQYSAVKVELFSDREVKTTHYQTQSYSFDSTATVSLGSDGVRTNEVGSSVSKSTYGTTVYETANTWERTYDDDGKYPTKYTSTSESKTNGVVTYSNKQVTTYGSLGRAIEYNSEYKSIYNTTTYVSTSQTKYDPATFKVMSTMSTSTTYINGILNYTSSYKYEYSNGIIKSYSYSTVRYDATGKQTASSKQETLYSATGRVLSSRSESTTVSGTATYVSTSETIYDPVTYKIASSGSSSATYVNGKVTTESSTKYKYTNGIISSYTYNSSRYDAAGNKIGYSNSETLYGSTGRVLSSRSDSNNIYGSITYISSYYSVYDPVTYLISSSGGSSAIMVNGKMNSRSAYAYKYNSTGRVKEYTYIYSRFDSNGIATESVTTVTHYTDSGIIDKRDTTGNVFGNNGITLATYVTNCVFDATGRLTAQTGSIDMSGINLTLKYDVTNGYVSYTHVIDEYGNELQRFSGVYTVSTANIVKAYVKEVTDRVNSASFNLDFNGDGKLTEAGDYGLMKWLISGNPRLLGYLTPEAGAKLDLNLDGRLTSDDVVLYGTMIMDVDKLVEFAKILNIGVDLRFDLNGDSKVDAADLAIMDEALIFMVDINKDGVVDAADIASLGRTLDGSLDLNQDGIYDYGDYYYLNDARYKLASTYTSYNDNTQIYVYGGYYRITKNEDGTLTMTDIYYGDTATSLPDNTIELDGAKYAITIKDGVVTLKYVISPEEAQRLDINQDGVIDYNDLNELYSMYEWQVDVNQDGVVDNTDLEALEWSFETADDVNGDGLIDRKDYSALISLIEAAALISRDVNQDGVIDQADLDLAVSNYVLAVKHAAHLPADTFAALDQDKDGAITAADSAIVAGQISKIVEDIGKIKEFAELLSADPIDVNKDGVIDINDVAMAKDGYILTLKYIAYVPSGTKAMLDRNGDGLVNNDDNEIARVDIEEYIAVIKEAREHVDNLVYDADEGWGNIEDYIELVEVSKLDNGNFSVLVRVDNFDFTIEVIKYYNYFYVQSTSVTDTTGNYPGKIEDALTGLFNCDKEDLFLDLDYYSSFYDKTAGTVAWQGYVNIDGYWTWIYGVYNVDTLDAGIDPQTLEPILAAKSDMIANLNVAVEDIAIKYVDWGSVEASAAGFRMNYGFNTEYDYNTGTYHIADFKLKAIYNNSGKDIYGAALTYLAGTLNVNKDNINVSKYSVEADGTMKFVLKHNGNLYDVSVNIGTGEVIIAAPDQQAAKDRVIADALARDWNFNIEAGTYEGDTYYRIECENVNIKSISDMGNGLYEVKADITLKEAREYGYSYTRSVTYYVGTKANNITKFDYNYGDVTVEMLDLKEVVDLSDYWNESNYEVKLAIDGMRVKQTGETVGSYSWYDYYSGKTVTNTQKTTWERVFDAGGKFPVSFKSKYEYAVDGVLKDVTDKSIEYFGDGEMSVYSNHSKSYGDNGMMESEEKKDIAWNEAGVIIDNAYKYAEYDNGWTTTYLNEYRYRYTDAGIMKSRMDHDIYEYSGRKTDYTHTVEYDETGYRMASEYLLNTVVKDGRTVEYQYKNAVYNASGNYVSLNENSYRLNDDGSYANWMNHYVYTDWMGKKLDEYNSSNYDTTGNLTSDSHQKSVYNEAGGLIENGSRYASYDEDGTITYLSEWRNNYWDDGNSKTRYNHSISTDSYSGQRYESSSQTEYDESGWRRTSESSWNRTTESSNTVSYSSRNATFDGDGNYTYLYDTSYALNENFTYKSYMTHSIYIDYMGTKVDDYQNRGYDDSGKLESENRTRYVWNEDGTLIENSGKYANYDTATGAYTYLDDWQNVYFDNGNLERTMDHNIYIDSYSGIKTDYYCTNEYETKTNTWGYEYSVRIREYVDKTVTKGSVTIEDWYKDARYDTDGYCTYLWESNRAKYDDGTDKSVMTHSIYIDYWSGRKTDDYSKKTYHDDGTLSGENINKSVWNGDGTRTEYKYLYSTYAEDGTLTYLTEDHDLYWDNGKLKSEHNHYVSTDYYTGNRRDQSTDSAYNVNGVRTSYDESVSNYGADGALDDSYTLNRDYNSTGTLTSMEGRVVVPSDDGTQASYRVVYDINASGSITYTHVYDAEGQEVPELGGQYYIHPTNIINEIKDNQNAEIEANEAAGAIEQEEAGAVAGDEDAYKVLDLKEQIELQKQSTNGIPVYSEPVTGDESLAQNNLAQ